MASNEIRILEERIRHLEQQIKLQQVQFGKLAQSVFDNSELRNLKDMNALKNFGRWQSWTPTVTGWAAGYICIARCCVVGKLCHWDVYITGTSNSTKAMIDTPFTSANIDTSFNWTGECATIIDNDIISTTGGNWTIDNNSNEITFYKDFANGSFTAGGTKTIRAQGFFEIA